MILWLVRRISYVQLMIILIMLMKKLNKCSKNNSKNKNKLKNKYMNNIKNHSYIFKSWNQKIQLNTLFYLNNKILKIRYPKNKLNITLLNIKIKLK